MSQAQGGGLSCRVTQWKEGVESNEQVWVSFEELVDLRHETRYVDSLVLEGMHY